MIFKLPAKQLAVLLAAAAVAVTALAPQANAEPMVEAAREREAIGGSCFFGRVRRRWQLPKAPAGSTACETCLPAGIT